MKTVHLHTNNIRALQATQYMNQEMNQLFEKLKYDQSAHARKNLWWSKVDQNIASGNPVNMHHWVMMNTWLYKVS